MSITTTLAAPRVNPDQHWSRSAFCGRQPDLWHTGANPDWGQVAQALHGCRVHCPVLALRHRAAQGAGYRSTVVGGVYYNQYGRMSAYQPPAASCRWCRPGGV